MTPQLRLLTGLASVLFLVAVAMIWQQRLFGEGLLTVRSNGAQARVAQSVLLVGATLFAAAWTLTIVAVTAVPRRDGTEERDRWLPPAILFAYSLFATGQIATPSDMSRVAGYFLALAIVWFFTARWWRGWTYRLVGVVFVTAAISYLTVSTGPRSCALLLVAATWLLCQRETKRAGSDGEVSLAFALVVFVLVGGFESVTWLTLGAQEAGTHMLGRVVWIAFLVLAPVLLLAGTEIADFGAALGQGALAHSVRRDHGAVRALAVTAIVAVLDVVAAVTFLSWVVVVSAIGVLGLTFAFGALVYRVQAYRPEDRTPVPEKLLIALAVGLALVLSWLGYLGDIEAWAVIGMVASLFLGIAVIGPASAADRLRPRSEGRFLTLVALCALAVGAVTVVLLHFALPLSFTNVAWGFGGAIGAGTLIAVAWLLGVRREPLDRLTPLLRQLFALNLGASVIALVAVVLAEASAAGERLSKWQAAVIFVALVWDFATSGAETNTDGTTLPRQTRVLLFLSYLLAVAAGVLLLRQSRLVTLPVDWPPPFDSELLTRSGLLMLGYPLLFFLLLPGLSGAAAELRRRADERPAPAWRHRLTNVATSLVRRPKAVAAHLPRPLERTASRMGATLGALALLLGLVVAMMGPNLLLLVGLSAGQGPAPADWKDVVSRGGDFELRYPAIGRCFRAAGSISSMSTDQPPCDRRCCGLICTLSGCRRRAMVRSEPVPVAPRAACAAVTSRRARRRRSAARCPSRGNPRPGSTDTSFARGPIFMRSSSSHGLRAPLEHRSRVRSPGRSGSSDHPIPSSGSRHASWPREIVAATSGTPGR
jgi:hypothetical protein